MPADKFNCPKCGMPSTVSAVVHAKSGTMTRYRHCRICSLDFATVEALKETPRLRQIIGEDKASKIWPAPPFKYRTPKQIEAQQNRASKPKT
jgi:transcriptional regulator NrdR family protein